MDGMKPGEIRIDSTNKTAVVNDFIGFTPDWDEIIVPYDRELVLYLVAHGYDVDFTSYDI